MALVIVSALATLPARAQEVGLTTWSIVPHADGNLGLAFSLGWTLGTHEGKASEVTGSVQARLEPLAIAQGEFRVPIAAMSTGSVSRDCHMREALGLDYARSRFPEEHVCVSDQLPASGPDSVAFPDIVVRMRGSGPGPTALLELSLHGRTNRVSAPVRLQRIGSDVQVQTEFELKLADFGITVIMPPLMRVADHVTVRLNVLLREVKK
ncbi:MAG: YceI family protein [Vicinamibacterales bacterium]